MKHKIIETWIQGQIKKGLWKPGTQIPTETKLMEKFSVSKMTVRKAISYLVSTGSLISIKGSGVFVSKFILPNTYETLREVLDIDEVTTVEISTKIPQILLNIASTKETHSDFIAFLRTYKKNNVNIAYSINWLPKSKDRNSLHIKDKKKIRLSKVIGDVNNIHRISKMELSTTDDIKIIGGKKGHFTPTDYLFFNDSKNKTIMFRVSKIKPEHYSVKNNQFMK